jgi:hypothetical protein
MQQVDSRRRLGSRRVGRYMRIAHKCLRVLLSNTARRAPRQRVSAIPQKGDPAQEPSGLWEIANQLRCGPVHRLRMKKSSVKPLRTDVITRLGNKSPSLRVRVEAELPHGNPTLSRTRYRLALRNWPSGRRERLGSPRRSTMRWQGGGSAPKNRRALTNLAGIDRVMGSASFRFFDPTPIDRSLSPCALNILAGQKGRRLNPEIGWQFA